MSCASGYLEHALVTCHAAYGLGYVGWISIRFLYTCFQVGLHLLRSSFMPGAHVGSSCDIHQVFSIRIIGNRMASQTFLTIEFLSQASQLDDQVAYSTICGLCM